MLLKLRTGLQSRAYNVILYIRDNRDLRASQTCTQTIGCSATSHVNHHFEPQVPPQ